MVFVIYIREVNSALVRAVTMDGKRRKGATQNYSVTVPTLKFLKLTEDLYH